MLDGRFETADLDRMPVANIAHNYLARVQGFREYRPDGWHPKIQVEGAEHIEAALARGHGVVLWVSPFAYSDLVTKKGLHEAGYRVSHLSRPEHNISDSAFGVAVLNPIWTRIENRYLAERVIIRNNDAASALETLRTRLKQNRIVSITVGDQANRLAYLNLFKGKQPVATGPLHLTRTMNSVLLPVFTVIQESGTFAVVIESPLMIGSTDREEAYESIAQRYARRLERYLLQYPDQWNADPRAGKPGRDAQGRMVERKKPSASL